MQDEMEGMVLELQDLRRKKIFNQDELKQIIDKRREFEYSIRSRRASQLDFLGYVRYEVAVECLRSRRSKQKGWKHKSVSDYSGITRIGNIFKRCCWKFKGDKRIWYQFADYCMRAGVSNLLTMVLRRALKHHPKEVGFWLLASDRELKVGHISGGRKLLLRGIRTLPTSAKLWSELMNLEMQIARHMLAVRAVDGLESALNPKAVTKADEGQNQSAEAASEKSEGINSAPVDSWAPARLLLKKGLERLSGMPRSCSEFLIASDKYHRMVDPDMVETMGFDQLTQELRSAVADYRPGDFQKNSSSDCADDTAIAVWELWWSQELRSGSHCISIVEAVATLAPQAVIRSLAVSLSARVPCAATAFGNVTDRGNALLRLAQEPRVAADVMSALSVLEALDRGCNGVSASSTSAAFEQLLRTAASSHPSCSRLAALAWRRLSGASQPEGRGDVADIAKRAHELDGAEAAQMLLLVISAPGTSSHSTATDGGKQPEQTNFETLLRALKKGASPQPLVNTFLGHALGGGIDGFVAASDHVWAVGSRLWDEPRLRHLLAASVLEAECRATSAAVVNHKRQLKLAARFEELLSTLDDGDEMKVEWWLRYGEFLQHAAARGCTSGLPSPTDVHWRAMRSVKDQEFYAEQAFKRLQLGSA